MTQKFVNNFAATVAQTFGAADTYLYINNAAPLGALAAGEYYLLTVFRKTGVEESGHEVVKVTAITDNMLTVERSAEGAAASLFNVGDHVECRVTAKGLTDKADSAHHHDSSYEPKNANIQAHIADTDNPHGVTKAQVGLSNVDNTSDADKPVSTAQQAALNGKENTGTAAAAVAAHEAAGDPHQQYQPGLVSGTNIKTVNSTSLLGSGNITTGDVVGQASSIDGEVALFSGTGGKEVKRATGSGLAKLTSGVLSTASAGTDYVTPTGSEVLTNKEISGGTFSNGYTEETYAPAAGSSFTFDFANGTIQGYTTNANTTITLPAVVAGKSFSIQISFGGAHTLTWAGGTIAWAGNTVPSFSGASGKTDTISFMANVAGTKWIGTAFALGSAT